LLSSSEPELEAECHESGSWQSLIVLGSGFSIFGGAPHRVRVSVSRRPEVGLARCAACDQGRRSARTQNSLPSGSARQTRLSSPVWPTSACRAPRPPGEAAATPPAGDRVAVVPVDPPTPTRSPASPHMDCCRSRFGRPKDNNLGREAYEGRKMPQSSCQPWLHDSWQNRRCNDGDRPVRSVRDQERARRIQRAELPTLGSRSSPGRHSRSPSESSAWHARAQGTPISPSLPEICQKPRHT
jgi:hypothetical protein